MYMWKELILDVTVISTRRYRYRLASTPRWMGKSGCLRNSRVLYGDGGTGRVIVFLMFTDSVAEAPKRLHSQRNEGITL